MYQAVLSFESKKAFIFCRNNALYISYYQNGLPKEPIMLENGIDNRFVVLPEQDCFKICVNKESGETRLIRVREKNTDRIAVNKNIALLNKSNIFLYGKNNIVYSNKNEITDITNKRISYFDAAGYCRCFYINDEGFVVFVNKDVFLYGIKRNKLYEVSQSKGRLIDISACSDGGRIYIALLFKTNNGYETVFKVIDNTGGTKPLMLLKTSSAENVFVYTANNDVIVLTLQQNGTIFYRQANLNTIMFSDVQQFKSGSSGKIYCFCVGNMKCSFTDILCRSDGRIIYPKGVAVPEDKLEQNDKEEIINSFNIKLYDVERKMAETVNSLQSRLRTQIEINNEMRKEINRLRKICDIQKDEDYTIYLTKAKVIDQ